MVNIHILAGKDEIGGTFIRVEDKDRILILDQGFRFKAFKRYFGLYMQPRGLDELRSFGVLPAPEWYEGATGIYISHLHLDHLGSLANIPIETKVYLPSKRLYERLEQRWERSPSWTGTIMGSGYLTELEELKPHAKTNDDIEAIPVYHSAYPACSYLYFGSDETILYTGDFRLDTFLDGDIRKELYPEPLLEYMESNRDIKIDTLIMEGTNFGRSYTPISAEEATAVNRRMLESELLTVLAVNEQEIDFLIRFAALARELKKSIVVSSEGVARFLDAYMLMNDQLKQELTANVRILNTVQLPILLGKVDPNELRGGKDILYIVSARSLVDDLRELEVHELLRTGLVGITESEPADEEGVLFFGKVLRWLGLFGLTPSRIRVSGHIHPHELKKVISVIKPKRVIPVHTQHPAVLKQIAERLM